MKLAIFLILTPFALLAGMFLSVWIDENADVKENSFEELFITVLPCVILWMIYFL